MHIPKSLAVSHVARAVKVTPRYIERLAATIAKQFDIPITAVLGENRTAPVSRARQMIMHLVFEKSGCSVTRLALAMNRDRSTVMHGIERSKFYYENDPKYKAAFDRALAGMV